MQKNKKVKVLLRFLNKETFKQIKNKGPRIFIANDIENRLLK